MHKRGGWSWPGYIELLETKNSVRVYRYNKRLLFLKINNIFFFTKQLDKVDLIFNLLTPPSLLKDANWMLLNLYYL